LAREKTNKNKEKREKERKMYPFCIVLVRKRKSKDYKQTHSKSIMQIIDFVYLNSVVRVVAKISIDLVL
jgi:hypothetical protein